MPVHRYKQKIVILLGVKVEDKFIICLEIGDYSPNNTKLLGIFLVCYI